MSEFVVTETQCGKVKGIRKVSELNTNYNAFYGIRYAKPPIGDLRFKAPLPAEKYDGVYDASEEMLGCIEKNTIFKKIMGSEDGLKMNVYTKNLTPKKLQPVMLYIHGGGYGSGSSSTTRYSPDYLMMADIVLVIFNYRIGALGFLSLKDETLKVPGNAGLKDQLMALKFVKNNIHNFGGDPNNITLFGNSSGGCSVHWHCLLESSKGLFHRAILMSGCIFTKGTIARDNNDWAYRLAKKLGFEGKEDDKEILEFLQKADPVRIVECQSTIIEAGEKNEMTFAPIIEPYTNETTMISRTPLDLIRTTWSNDIDILIGGTSGEGIAYVKGVKDDPELLNNFEIQSVLPSEVCSDLYHPAVVNFVENVKKIYFSNPNDSIDESAYCKIKGDEVFWHPLVRVVQSRQNSGGSGRTFLYRFDVDSPTQNHYRIRNHGPEQRGVSHADELSYVYFDMFGPVPERDSMEFKSIQRFVSLLTSFASSGNPTENAIQADLQNVEFSPVDSWPFKALNIGEEVLEFLYLPECERLAVWNQLYKEGEAPLF